MVERIARPQPVGRRPAAGPGRRPADGEFGRVLAGKLAGLNFSGHARERLAQAGRTLTPAELARVETALDRVAAKGARDALVLLPDLALVVSVSNQTVITAVSGARMRDNVFTQIDSAVIL